jgi:hypothetical protein
MRIVELSDHPASLLRRERQRRSAQADAERRRFEAALVRHRGRLDEAARARDRARAEHRWWAWLTGSLAVRRERRLMPTAPPPPQPPSDQEAIITAGIEGEQRAELGLGTKLGDEWVLLRGYRNNRGEIGRGEMTDKKGRSPSQQLNEPADQLEGFLRSRGHQVRIQRIVLLTHDRSRLGTCTNSTVHVTTSTAQVIKLIGALPASVADPERAQIERLVVRDHDHFETRRTGDRGTARGSRGNKNRPRAPH